MSPGAEEKGMAKKKVNDHAQALTKAAREQASARYVLRLYVVGLTPKSQRAIKTIQNLCELHLKGRYELEIVDIYQQPELLQQEQIIVAPTLIKKLPLPLRRIIGDMADREKVLLGLDLRPKE
jgi:circadian clock protein KaiB